jgi:acyl carrier protein
VTEKEIFERLKRVLVETFELDSARITPGATLFDDLDLDSIDAVDLAIKLQEITGKRIRPQEFKAIRTVGDVVVAVRALLAA